MFIFQARIVLNRNINSCVAYKQYCVPSMPLLVIGMGHHGPMWSLLIVGPTLEPSDVIPEKSETFL
jgi:hypothetical protein